MWAPTQRTNFAFLISYFHSLICTLWQVYKLRFVLWLRNWKNRAIEVERSLRVCVGVLCWGDLSRGQPLFIFSPHFCSTHECTLLLFHMIRMQRSREKESKEMDLVRHSLEKCATRKRATKQLVSGVGTSEWQPGFPGFLLHHMVSSSQYLPSRVKSVPEYRVYNTWVLRRSSMTHEDCTEC